VQAADKIQGIQQTAATESQQEAKTKGTNATGPDNVLESKATNSNVARTVTSNTGRNDFTHVPIGNETNKEDQEEDEFYKDSEELQHQQHDLIMLARPIIITVNSTII